MLKALQFNYPNMDEATMKDVMQFMAESKPAGLYLFGADIDFNAHSVAFSASGNDPDAWVDAAVEYVANQYSLAPSVYAEVNLVKSLCKTPAYETAIATGAIDPVVEAAKPDVDLLPAEAAEGTFSKIVGWIANWLGF